jgi:hypothetical protein
VTVHDVFLHRIDEWPGDGMGIPTVILVFIFAPPTRLQTLVG